MTDDTQTRAMVFKDQVGNYFVLPQETLEQGRVPEERKAEVERLLAESDVSGFVIGVLGAIVLTHAIAWGVAAVGASVAKGAAEGVEATQH